MKALPRGSRWRSRKPGNTGPLTLRNTVMRSTWRLMSSPGKIRNGSRVHSSARPSLVRDEKARRRDRRCRCSISTSTEPAGTWEASRRQRFNEPKRSCDSFCGHLFDVAAALVAAHFNAVPLLGRTQGPPLRQLCQRALENLPRLTQLKTANPLAANERTISPPTR